MSPEPANGTYEDPLSRWANATRGVMERNGVRQSAAAEEVGVSRAVLNNWLTARREPSPEQALALERAIGAVPGETVVHLGYGPPVTEEKDMLDVSGLTSGQQRLLKLTVDEWRRENRRRRQS